MLSGSLATNGFVTFVSSDKREENKKLIDELHEVVGKSEWFMKVIQLAIREFTEIVDESQLLTEELEETTYLDFYLDENDRLCLKREGAEAEPLVSENVKINNLVFNHLTASSTESVRIELSAIYSCPSEKITYQATTTLISSASLRND